MASTVVDRDPIIVTVIGGYLGAGKTTLVNRVLRESRERIGVIVNDFGAINIDEDLIVAADDDKITLANGCICCSLVDGFAAALDVLRSVEDPPHRLVIEASGVADPAQIAAYGHAPGLRLDGVITVADAETVRRQGDDLYVGDVVRLQLSAADLVVLNKADLVDLSATEATEKWVAEVSPTAVVVAAEQCDVPLSVLLGSFDGKDRTNESEARPAEERFQSWSYEFERPLRREALESALSTLPGGIVRAKGVVRFGDDPDVRQVVQRVGARQSITADGPWTGGPSRLVLVGLRDALAEDHFEAQMRGDNKK